MSKLQHFPTTDYFHTIQQFEEQNHQSQYSNKKGIVYTNKDIAMEIVELLAPELHETILEPSCGAGVFLIALLEYIKKRHDPSTAKILEYVETKLFFSDIDGEALEHSVYIVNRWIADNYEPTCLLLNSKKIDSLSQEWQFNLIFGNPPYIRFQNLDEENRSFLRDYYHYCSSGNIDIYYAFIELAQRYSNRSVLIIPNSYLTNSSAKLLRAGIASNVVSIKDHKNSKKFKNASTYTTILQLNKNACGNVLYASTDEYSTISRDRLQKDGWYLDSSDSQIKNGSKKLSDIACVYCGINTNADKAFMLSKSSLHNGFYTTSHNNKDYLIEESICVALKKISRLLGKFRQDDIVIIFPYENVNDIMSENNLKTKYPFAYKYLLDIKEGVLDKRDNGRVKKYDAWYAYGRRQGINIDFKQKKCHLIPDSYKKDDFTQKEILSMHRFLHVSGYVVVPKEGHEEEVKEVLNSKKLQEHLKNYGKSLAGGYTKINTKLIKGYCL
jgi:methylase of polypeptide subunit release factors